jgi:hypothetical protein
MNEQKKIKGNYLNIRKKKLNYTKTFLYLIKKYNLIAQIFKHINIISQKMICCKLKLKLIII